VSAWSRGRFQEMGFTRPGTAFFFDVSVQRRDDPPSSTATRDDDFFSCAKSLIFSVSIVLGGRPRPSPSWTTALTGDGCNRIVFFPASEIFFFFSQQKMPGPFLVLRSFR